MASAQSLCVKVKWVASGSNASHTGNDAAQMFGLSNEVQRNPAARESTAVSTFTSALSGRDDPGTPLASGPRAQGAPPPVRNTPIRQR